MPLPGLKLWDELNWKTCSKVQLCIFGRLSKDKCIAVYLFIKWFHRFRKSAGWLNTALYLKACSVSLMRAYAGSWVVTDPTSHPVSLNRSGLPRCIPAFHRRVIREKSERADLLVRFYLSLFSISRLILVVKRESYRFESICARAFSPSDNVVFSFRKHVVPLVSRYVPRLFETPMRLGFRWIPLWSSSPTSGRKSVWGNLNGSILYEPMENLGHDNKSSSLIVKRKGAQSHIYNKVSKGVLLTWL